MILAFDTSSEACTAALFEADGRLARRADERIGRGHSERLVPMIAELIAEIRELIDTRVRPAVAQDGGDIVYRGYRDGTLYLAMQGACSGCPSSAITLKRGIEGLIKHYVPEVEAIEAI